MGRVLLAVRVFFRVLFDAQLAGRLPALLAGEAPAASPPPAAERPASKPTPRVASRSEALSLLAALQREARFVDFVQEPIASYSDAQIGAAARDVHRQCAAVLERFFAFQPVVAAPEGSMVDVPAGTEAARFRLVGNVTGSPPHRGKLCHHGWQATRAELPDWTGSGPAALVVAPAEVEI